MVPLPASVREIAVYDTETEIQVYYAPGIVGMVRVKNDFYVKLLEEEKSGSWWKKIIPW
jgi:hypothetical protein